MIIDMNKILDEAIQRGASDVHLICGNKPMLRIIRELVPVSDSEVLTEDNMYEIYDYLIRGNLQLDEVYNATKKLDTSFIYRDIRLRVNIAMADGVPTSSLRLIKNELPTYESLGVPDIVRRMTYQTQGLVLVTGKTNSGKTTTLNSLINFINENQNKKILTLENPIEYKHTSKNSLIVQRELGRGKDFLSFSDGVKNSLREDCDILVIGEIRDKETMEAAIETAESGHLVIGTLHTRSCAEAIDRIINLYEQKEQSGVKYLLSSLLKLVTAQRLIPGVDGIPIMIPEVMVVDNTIAGLIRKDKFSVSQMEDAIQSSADIGSISLINSLAQKYIDGKITLEMAKSQIEEKNIVVLNRTIDQIQNL